MGLARDSRKALRTGAGAIDVVQPNFDEIVADGAVGRRAPMPEAVRYIEQLVRSIPRTRG